jgi:hypothetical protein
VCSSNQAWASIKLQLLNIPMGIELLFRFHTRFATVVKYLGNLDTCLSNTIKLTPKVSFQQIEYFLKVKFTFLHTRRNFFFEKINHF